MRVFRILSAAVATLTSALILFSCDPLEPSTYYEQIFRIGTVKLNGNIASISMDCSDEAVIIDDFKTKADMESYGLQPEDRVFVSLDFNATGSMDNCEITINQINKIETRKFETSKPADTLNYYFQFTKFGLYTVEYPAIWAVGHLVNFAPICFVPEEHGPVNYYLNPIGFENDTLLTRLYSYIPDCDISLNPQYTQSLLCYDLASLREQSRDPENQAIRDTILARLERMPNETFTFTVMTPDTLRAKNSKSTEAYYLQPVANLPKSVSVKFDF